MNQSYSPTHQHMARVEHAIVVNQRKIDSLRQTGQIDKLVDLELELEFLYDTYQKRRGNSYHFERADIWDLEFMD